jgi:hypothetical protein
LCFRLLPNEGHGALPDHKKILRPGRKAHALHLKEDLATSNRHDKLILFYLIERTSRRPVNPTLQTPRDHFFRAFPPLLFSPPQAHVKYAVLYCGSAIEYRNHSNTWHIVNAK